MSLFQLFGRAFVKTANRPFVASHYPQYGRSLLTQQLVIIIIIIVIIIMIIKMLLSAMLCLAIVLNLILD